MKRRVLIISAVTVAALFAWSLIVQQASDHSTAPLGAVTDAQVTTDPDQWTVPEAANHVRQRFDRRSPVRAAVRFLTAYHDSTSTVWRTRYEQQATPRLIEALSTVPRRAVPDLEVTHGSYYSGGMSYAVVLADTSRGPFQLSLVLSPDVWLVDRMAPLDAG